MTDTPDPEAQRKVDEGFIKDLSSQGVLITGSLAGFGLAALVLVLEDSKAFEKPVLLFTGHQYFDGIIILLSTLVMVSALSSVLLGDAAANPSMTKEHDTGVNLLIASFILLMGALPVITVPFSHVVWAVVLVMEAIVLIISWQRT